MTMVKRAFLIHGWGGSPRGDWIPWLKNKLEESRFTVFVPAMPDTNRPKIEAWVSCLAKTIGTPDKNCYFIGHSIGCQTILRYLESLPKEVEVGGIVFIAGWFHLNPIAFEEKDDKKIASPWLKTPIKWENILTHTKNSVAILSDNDLFVPIEDAKIFKEKLGAKIIIEHNKGHFRTDDGITELPVALESILKISK